MIRGRISTGKLREDGFIDLQIDETKEADALILELLRRLGCNTKL